MGYETILTDARNSVWQAIDNFADLAGQIKTKFKFNDEGSCMKDAEPSFSDLTAVALLPMGVTPKWYTNEKQKWPYSLRIVTWTADWRLQTSEVLMMRLAKAIQSATPENSTKPYTADYQPLIGPNVGIQITIIKKENPIKVVKASLDIVLRCNFQPRP